VSDCNDVRELLAEYAAGVLDGRDLVKVEAHLRGCVSCRAAADEYVGVVDAVLGLAGHAEPPVGFEAGVLERIEATPRRRSLTRPVLVAAAAVALLLAGVAVGRSVSRPAPAQLQEFALRTPGATTVGWAWVHPGDPGWIYIDMRYRQRYPTVRVELETTTGEIVSVGELALDAGHGTLGVRSPVPVGEVRVIRMRDRDGSVVCHATIRV
jgi:hypothetical protein